MSFKRATAPSQINIYDEYISMLYSCEVAHDNIANLLLDANMLYGEASISEDIILNNFLSVYNTLKSISKNNNGTIIESFLSNESFDKSYKLDNYLNIDIQNGDLTLPINNTRTLQVESIIISNESNGLASSEYNNINSIIDTSPSALFIYEKTVNTLSTNVLVFDITLKLKEEDYCNGLYIKLFSGDGSSYPKIDKIELSNNGTEWEEINTNSDINKADYFIRFTPISARFVKLRFIQNSFSVINTNFGPRYKYSIGIRNILPKQTVYNNSGEYISTQFSTNKVTSSMIFNKVDTGLVEYYVSIDNGSKWEKIDINKLIPLYNFNENINSLNSSQSFRIKIKMDKTESIINKKTYEEFFSINKNRKYITKYIPINIESYIGGHISFGESSTYKIWINNGSSISTSILELPKCEITDPKRYELLKYVPYYDGIENDIILKINNSIVKNDRLIYSILPSEDKNNSILNLVSDELSKNGIIELFFKKYIHSHIENNSNIINLRFPTLKMNKENILINTIRYSQDPTIKDGTISASGEIIDNYEPLNAFDGDMNTYWRSDTKVNLNGENIWFIQSISSTEQKTIKAYEIQAVYESVNEAPYSIKLEGTNDNGITWIEIDSQNEIKYNNNNIAKFSINNKCSYSGYRLKIYSNKDDTSICKIANINLYEATEKNLDKSEFELLDRSTIKINESSYNPQYDYEISYLPAFDITDKITKKEGKTIELQVENINNSNATIGLVYDYGDKINSQAIHYYTPICNEYRIDIL